jgi:hypothetical protein
VIPHKTVSEASAGDGGRGIGLQQQLHLLFMSQIGVKGGFIQR